MHTTDDPATTPSRLAGAVIGLVSGAAALAAAQLAAGLVGAGSSPIFAVGGVAVDASPEWLKSFAIRTFGSNDKAVLLGGIGVVLAIAAIVLGIVSLRRPRAGVVGLIALGAIGAIAAVTRPANGIAAMIPSVIGTAAGLAAYAWLRHRAGLPPLIAHEQPPEQPPTPTGFDRRRFLAGSAAVAGLALAGGFVGEYFVRRSDANASRSAIRLPNVVEA